MILLLGNFTLCELLDSQCYLTFDVQNNLDNLPLTVTVHHLIVCPLETTPASPGVALGRPSQFSCFSLKLLSQKMPTSALLEVCYNLLKTVMECNNLVHSP